jgi:hypothetical protein
VKRPSLQFYPGDWMKDPAVRALSVEARGLWFDMLCLMHESSPRGYLRYSSGEPITSKDLARIAGSTERKVKVLLSEMERAKTFSRADDGSIFNRRMVRDTELTGIRRDAGAAGGNPDLTTEYNIPGYVYAMRRASDGAVKIGVSSNPTSRLYKIRYQLKENIELLATQKVERMGEAEAEFHRQYAHCKHGEWFTLSESETFTLISTLQGKDQGKNDLPPFTPRARAQSPSSSPSSSASVSPSANSASRGAVSETEEVLDSGFPGTGADTGFVARLYAAAEAAKPNVTDGELAEALRATYRENQQSPGLWLSTVPAYLRSAAARDGTEARPMMLVRARPKTARDAQIDDWKAQMREKYGEAV